MTRPKLPTDRHAVVIGADTTDVIRIVGPTAWVILIHIYGSPTAAGRSVTASTRTLATDLGLSKDTCARALRTLRDVGLVNVDTARTELGRFGTIRYRLLAPSKLVRHRRSNRPTSNHDHQWRSRLHHCLRNLSTPPSS